MNKIVLLSVILSLSLAFADNTEEVSEPNKPEQIEAEKAKRETRYGVRGNIGYATAFVPETQFTDGNMEVDGGLGLGIGAFALIPFLGILDQSKRYFVPEITLQQRTPINAKFKGNSNSDYVNYNITLKEIAIEVSLMFRDFYSEENLTYIGAGLLLGYVLSSNYDVGNNVESQNKERTNIDIGLAFELGFRINSNFSIDIRLTESFTSIGFAETFHSGESKSLWQLQTGVNYVF